MHVSVWTRVHVQAIITRAFPATFCCLQSLIRVSFCAVALQTLGGQYPVFSAAPTAKLMEEGKVHTVEHLINPLAMQHADHTAATAAATVMPSVSTPPPFQVCIMTPLPSCNLSKLTHNVKHRVPIQALFA